MGKKIKDNFFNITPLMVIGEKILTYLYKYRDKLGAINH
jgi:hypothetical protein